MRHRLNGILSSIRYNKKDSATRALLSNHSSPESLINYILEFYASSAGVNRYCIAKLEVLIYKPKDVKSQLNNLHLLSSLKREISSFSESTYFKIDLTIESFFDHARILNLLENNFTHRLSGDFFDEITKIEIENL